MTHRLCVDQFRPSGEIKVMMDGRPLWLSDVTSSELGLKKGQAIGSMDYERVKQASAASARAIMILTILTIDENRRTRCHRP